MNKPLLIVVTGSPASGKTTLAHHLAAKIHCPLLSRDELKEGLLNTLDLAHAQLEPSADQVVYDTFFETIDLLLSKGISIIAEAAFQDKLWKPKLVNFSEKAAIKILICKTNPELIKSRFTNRFLNDPDRKKYHGDPSLSQGQSTSLVENYKPVNMNTPTLQVDTTNDYHPSIEEIVNFIKEKDAIS